MTPTDYRVLEWPEVRRQLNEIVNMQNELLNDRLFARALLLVMERLERRDWTRPTHEEPPPPKVL